MKETSKKKSSSKTKTDKSENQGFIRLHENVVASVVKNATCAVNGVVRLSGSGLVDSIAGMIGQKNDSAVSIELNENNVKVEVRICIKYGLNIPTIALEIQNSIIKEVKSITGMDVSEVNVIIHELEFEVEEEKKENSKEEIQN